MIGKRVSHYKILEKLDRFAALKFLPPHLGADKEIKQRFIAMAFYEGGNPQEKN